MTRFRKILEIVGLSSVYLYASPGCSISGDGIDIIPTDLIPLSINGILALFGLAT